MNITRCLALVLVLVLMACGGSSSPVGPSGGGVGGGGVGGGGGSCTSAPMSALIDGQQWRACASVLAINDRRVGAIAMDGRDVLDSSSAILFGFAVPNRRGTFSTQTNSQLLIGEPGGTCWWYTHLSGGSASVTVTTFDTTENTASGTFSFTLVPAPSCPGATGNKRVTAGVFNVTFTNQN